MGARVRSTITRAVPRHGLVTAMVVALCTEHLWWISRHRTLLDVDADEARLLLWAAQAEHAGGHGPAALFHAWRLQPTSAPLVGVLSAGWVGVFGRSITAFLAVEVAFYAVLLVSVWSIARSLGAGRWAYLAVALVGVCPGVVEFTRVHQQIVPATAMLCACVAIGAQPDALQSRRTVVLLGVVMGGSLLVRAMLLPFVPCTVLALLAVAAWQRRLDRRAVANTAIAGVVGLAVAALWWGFAARTALRYLSGGGLHDGRPPLSPSTWADEARRAGRVLLGIPAYSWRWPVLGLIALVAGAALVHVLRDAEDGLRGRTAFVALMVASSFAILVFAADDHLGFSLLFTPLAVTLAVSVLARRPTVLFRIALGCLTAGTVLAAAHGFDAELGFYQVETRVHAGPRGTNDQDRRAWGRAYQEILYGDHRPSGPSRWATTFFDPMVYPTQLKWVASFDRRHLSIVEDADHHPELLFSASAFDRWAAKVSRQGRAVLSENDAFPSPDRPDTGGGFIPHGLRAAGFRVVRAVRIPDGRWVFVWEPRPA